MKRCLFVLMLCWVAFGLVAQPAFLENFDSGLPASAITTEQTYTLSTGEWKVWGVAAKNDNGSVRASMITNGYLITPLLSLPAHVTLLHRGSGSGKVLTVAQSINKGQSWTTIGTATVSSASAYGMSQFDIPAATDSVLLRFHCGSATIYLDNIEITFAAEPEEPEEEVPTIVLQPGAINFGNAKLNSPVKRSFVLSAKYLEPTDAGTISLTGSDDFLLSTSSSEGFTKELIIPLTGANLEPLTVFVQFTATELKSYHHQMIIIGGLACDTLFLSGTGSDSGVNVYYISPDGNDTNEGTFDSPWYNLQRAVNAIQPGDTIICRGGVYYPSMKHDGTKTTVRLNAKGTADKRFTIRNFPGEFPVFNFRDQPKKVSVRGVQLNGDYWYIFGLHFTEAGDNGMKIEGNYNRIERCTFSYNDDTGLQLGFGHDFSASGFGSSNDGSYCAYNDIVDCDAYLNCDSDNFGADADGFACKMHNGKGNRFIRCRAWDNADDAWDMYETDYAVYLIECWAWGSGRASNFGWVQASGSFQGNGNGIKLGGNGTGGNSKGIHEAWNCVSFNNNKTGSVKGFDQNSHAGGEKIINCLAFGNGYDFMFEQSSANRHYYNNVCFGNIEIAAGSNESHNAMLSTSTKAWKNNVIRGFSLSDYVSLSEAVAKSPRAANGSLPANFARLKSSSTLVDKGMIMSPPFIDEFPFLAQPAYGLGKDPGPYELQEGELYTDLQILIQKDAPLSLEIYPNPCTTEARVNFSLPETGEVKVELYQLNGQLQELLFQSTAYAGISYQLPISLAKLTQGAYICRLSAKDNTLTTKLIVIKE